jgi:hypothetical protein
MKRPTLFLLCAAATVAAVAAPNVTNTVMMVDQRGNLNVEGVASVADVATNAVKVQIAEAKAEAAQNTARGVTNALQAVAENIMSNNVVIYRSGFSDSFSALVTITDDDVLAIVEARWIEKTSARIVVEVDYVSTADLGTVKPIVFHRNTLSALTDFAELDDANVSQPVYHAEQRTYDGQTFAGYYTVTATIPNPSGTSFYFLWIKAEADTPSGDGTTLDLPNGVTGGVTGDFVWGDKVLHFRGGVLRGVEEDD